MSASVSPEPPYPSRPWREDPEWIGEICESAPFTEVFRFSFAKPGHINVNETRAYKSWIKSMAKGHRNSRFLGLLDSRVTLGAAAKGRSSSYAISRVLRGSLGYVISGNLYPGGLRCYSKANRADELSRNKPVRGPSNDFPGWLVALQAGDTRPFDALVESARVPRNAARWLRFLLLVAGDIEPNPGPTVRSNQYKPRGPINLQIGFAPETSNRMKQCVQGFQQWVA